MKLSMVSEADGRGEEGGEAAPSPLIADLPMTGHVLPSTLPYYPSLPGKPTLLFLDSFIYLLNFYQLQIACL